jgi:hypothetical protein
VSASDSPLNAVAVAKQLAQGLHAQNREYALGGAIALGYWGSPRGTVDVDVTIFLPPDCSDDCIWLLQEIGCEFSQTEAIDSFAANGFCRVAFAGLNVDVFLPIVPFYETARKRRKEVNLGGQMVAVWDAESLAVFKMMFFRRKDLADVEQILRTQGVNFDRSWVCEQLVDIYGARDPRISAWDELVREVPAK